VSQATVSRVLSGGVVSDGTRQRVLSAIQSTGYAPNSAARSMRMGRSGAVGIVVADLDNPFYPRMLSALSEELDGADFRVVVWLASQDGSTAAVRAIRERTIDGVIFTTATEGSLELTVALEEGRPVVLVNRPLSAIECDQVASDNDAGAALIARHFLELGRTRMAFIGGTPLATTSGARLRGFLGAIGAAGVEVEPGFILEGEYSHEWGRTAIRHLLEARNPPDAVFCANDLLAFGALDGARELGVSVPQSMAVAGYDDVAMAQWPAYSLTTVRQDVALTARVAVQYLIDRVAGEACESRRRFLEPELIVRGSTSSSRIDGVALTTERG